MSNFGIVYLIHFAQPFKHAQHYIGWTNFGCLEQRMRHHRNGNGARLMHIVTKAGIEWTVVRTWENATKSFERRLKRTRKASIYCPVCKQLALDRKRLAEIGCDESSAIEVRT